MLGGVEPILMNKNKALNFYEKENCSNHIYAKQKTIPNTNRNY